MPRRLCLASASSIAALLLSAPAAFAGSSEAGWGCTATGSEPGVTLLATPEEGFPYSPLVKENPGVIVGWTVRVEPGLGRFAQQLGVFRPAGNGEYTKVAESAVETFGETPELVQYPARIPVQQGDVLGLFGPEETLYCLGGPAARFAGPIAVGETKAFTMDGHRSPVNAVVEEDLDRDGYGDFSQDRCPNSALFQTDCPLPAVYVGKVTVRKRAIWIEASNNTEASFEVRGEVRWRKSPGGKKMRVGLSSGAAVQVGGATLVVLRVPLPKSVRNRLEQLPRRQSLRARVDVRATNLVPYVGTHELEVKLPGRKPATQHAQ
ncbi:MAG TPA: hypothetical protein VF125_02765 [Solirubrobacterales bacterium]